MSVRYERRWLAECIDPDRNADKFYEIYFIEAATAAADYTVLFHWGRRGGKGQSQVHHFDSVGKAEAAFMKKQSDKLREYTTVAEDGPGHLSRHLEIELESAGPVHNAPRTSDATQVTLEAVSIDLSNFVQDLLVCSEVTPAMVTRRNAFLESMETLKRAIAEAEATADLMDTVYKKRLA